MVHFKKKSYQKKKREREREKVLYALNKLKNQSVNFRTPLCSLY